MHRVITSLSLSTAQLRPFFVLLGEGGFGGKIRGYRNSPETFGDVVEQNNLLNVFLYKLYQKLPTIEKKKKKLKEAFFFFFSEVLYAGRGGLIYLS